MRRLHVRDVSSVYQAELLEAVAACPLLPKLEQFSYDALDLDDVPPRHRSAFAHLKQLE